MFPDGQRDATAAGHKPGSSRPVVTPVFPRPDKTFASTGHGHEEVARRKARREARTEVFQCIDNFDHSYGINPTEGPATKWRKPDSEHRANVAVAG